MKDKRIRMNELEIKILIKFLSFSRVHSANDLTEQEQDILHSLSGRLKHGGRRMLGERTGYVKYRQQSEH